jgi:hypothetical protein
MSHSSDFSPTDAQFASVLALLHLNPKITLLEFKKKVTAQKFNDDKSNYFLFHYKAHLEDLAPEWEKIRGIIIKDYTTIVAYSHGRTSTLRLTKSLPSRGPVDFSEIRDDGSLRNHSISLDEECYIRVAFQGTIVRVWLSNGEVRHSTLRKYDFTRSKWNKSEENDSADFTFAQMYQLLSGYGKELFEPGMENSPFCHTFLMVTPQNASHSNLNIGAGYVLYLDTYKCYTPMPEDPLTEQECYIMGRIPKVELTDEDRAYGIRERIDKLFFALSKKENFFQQNIPPPSAIAELRDATAVYSIDESMGIGNANVMMKKGVSEMEDKDYRLLKDKYPELLPGEATYLTREGKNGTETYILEPKCVVWRKLLVGGGGNRRRQLCMLRYFAVTDDVFKMDDATKNNGLINFVGRKFESQLLEQSVVFPDADGYFYGLDSETKIDLENFSFLHPPVGTIKYTEKHLRLEEGDNVVNRGAIANRWNVLFFFFVLAISPHQKRLAFDSYRNLQAQIKLVKEFIYSKAGTTFFPDLFDAGRLNTSGIRALERITRILNAAKKPDKEKWSRTSISKAIDNEDPVSLYKIISLILKLDRLRQQ